MSLIVIELEIAIGIPKVLMMVIVTMIKTTTMILVKMTAAI